VVFFVCHLRRGNYSILHLRGSNPYVISAKKQKTATVHLGFGPVGNCYGLIVFNKTE